MIPASYMFKAIYDQAWSDPEPAKLPPAPQRPGDGLLTPITDALAALLARRPHAHAGRRLNGFAYD